MVIVVNINRKWMWGISSLILSLFSVVFQIHNTFIFLSTRLFVEELNRELWNLHIKQKDYCMTYTLFLPFEYQQPCAVQDPHHDIRGRGGGEGRGGGASPGSATNVLIQFLFFCFSFFSFLFFFFFRSIFLFPNLNNNNDNNNKHHVISYCQFPQGPRRPF